MRTVITGVPRSGKTTMSEDMSHVRHTDDNMGVGWSQHSEAVSYWFDSPGPWVIEGVAAVRALRKWLKRTPTGMPCDTVVYLDREVVPLSKPQAIMASGCNTIWDEIKGELSKRGVAITLTRLRRSV